MPFLICKSRGIIPSFFQKILDKKAENGYTLVNVTFLLLLMFISKSLL